MNKKSSKSKNFSFAEEEELMNLVSKYWAVVQCKTTNHVNNMKKKEYWSKIESELNAVIPNQFRPASVLKCKIENICRRAQKKKVENGKQLSSTGGGKAVLAEYVSADERVLALLGKRASGLISNWCDDQVVVSNTVQSRIDEVDDEYEVEEVCYDDDLLLENTFQEPTFDNIYQNESTLPETSWAKYTPGMLRQPKSTPLSFTRKLKENNVEVSESGQTKRKKGFQDKITKWAQEKALLTEQESNLQREEAEFKREVWRVKIDREKELLKEVKDRIRFQAEKHAAEMELLKTKINNK
ncbi:uncharacterized protein LOC126552947 [Aphis gossypii]|uniref:uncharacterized protein LOC126552947 n=1 Tax=Aphis gossypii TaxID=80765 RepID=UPI002158DC35|nr:uncharacterized protein LOC126552947 [Aphis gossypii]